MSPPVPPSGGGHGSNDLETAVALAKMSTSLESLTRSMHTLQESLNERLNTFVLREVYANELLSLRAEVKTLKDAQQWVYRIIIGVVIVAVLGLVVVKPGNIA